MNGATNIERPSPRPPRVARSHVVACALAMLAFALWALWPLDRAPIAAPSIAVAAAAAGPGGSAPLDLAAFRAPLWIAPPAPPPSPIAAAPPPPLKLQLIAILREGGGEYRAALYDPDSDKLTVVGPGDTIAGRRIERVGKADVALRDGNLSRTLALRTEEGHP